MSDEQLLEKIKAMRKGGKILAQVRDAVVAAVVPGVPFEKLEEIAQRELKRLGADPSFPTVEEYKWATCITKNEGCVHGIPVGKTVEFGDIITIDVGALYGGYHTDTSITVCAGECSKRVQRFVVTGVKAVDAAIAQVHAGATVYDLSLAMQSVVEGAGYRCVYQLTGHGVGKKLHMDPSIPCYADERSKKDVLYEGQTLAVEIMYTMGNPKLVLATDGWTYETEDRSLSGMHEHTVLVTKDGVEVLTASEIESQFSQSF
ncbi:MAG: type I methionyl aminopeptidase [Patescibacteria group bacterium]